MSLTLLTLIKNKAYDQAVIFIEKNTFLNALYFYLTDRMDDCIQICMNSYLDSFKESVATKNELPVSDLLFAFAFLKADQGDYILLKKLSEANCSHLFTQGYFVPEMFKKLGIQLLASSQAYDIQQALGFLREAYIKDPCEENLILLSRCLIHQTRMDEAKVYLERGLLLFPKSNNVKKVLISLFMRVQNYAKAQELMQYPVP